MITRLVRNMLSDQRDDYVFYASDDKALFVDPKKEFGLYIHIPFCKSMCPYCPYNKVFYKKELATQFKDAIVNEIKRYNAKLGQRQFYSLYVGGGTPTLLIDELKDIVNELKRLFILDGPLAVETVPSDITDNKVRKLKEIGFDYISLGVQSFNDKYLSLIGRNHNADETKKAIELISQHRFKLFNIDLIFAFPEQNLKELQSDLIECLSFNPDQITCYPLFTFPYTAVGKYLKIKKLKMPPIKQRKAMYYLISDFFKKNSYYQSSVWGFNRIKKESYSSVTRDYYIGLGAGAASYTGEYFYFNTFSLKEYMKTLNQKLPIALKMNVSDRMSRLFWLYWRFYETRIPFDKYKQEFQSDIKKDFGFIFKLIERMNWADKNGPSELKLNKIGCHWIHLIQNQYALNYVNKIWPICQKIPWPQKIPL
ncbi:coproporphyrinogen-III oxidase family protein [Candidatus Omnitrophota bacterium]